MARGREIFERFSGAEAIRLAKAAMRYAQHAFQPNVIRPLQNIADIQQAPGVMQRWVMANPMVREQFHMQRCDGYSETYVDVHPQDRGVNHYDFRRVMSGVLQECTEEEGADWKVVNHFEFDHFDDVQLSTREKDDILTVWDLIEGLMKPGAEDPTSPYCNRL